MAKLIKETPILRGKDAMRFMDAMKENKKVSPEELSKIKVDYERIKSILKS